MLSASVMIGQRRQVVRGLLRKGSSILTLALCFTALICTAAGAWAQIPKTQKPAPSQAAPAETVQDPLGRSTPRGTVLGFLTAAYAHKYETAAQYLNTRVQGQET